MKKKLVSLLFILTAILILAPATLAADITAGGTIVLAEDQYLDKQTEITCDTILDLNGYALEGRTVTVAEGVRFTLKNGTMGCNFINRGSCIIENVFFDETMITNRKGGKIEAIRGCRILNEEGGILNWGGQIGLIEDCEIYVTDEVGSGISQVVNPEKGFASIQTIRNCKIESKRDIALDLSEGTLSLVEDCVLIGRESAIETRYGTIDLVKNCVLVGREDAALCYNGHPEARHDRCDNEHPQPRHEDCLMIAEKWTNAVKKEQLKGDELVIKYIEERLEEEVNCTFYKLENVTVEDYTAWEMPEWTERETGLPSAPVTPLTPGFANFAAVNTYTAGQFADVAASYWGAPNVAKAYELGLMKGSSDTAFDPEGSVTVAQTVTMADRLHSIYATGSENFVQSGLWYQTYVDYCKANGILKKDFEDYNAPAKRSDFAAILAAALPAEALSAINTVSVIPDVAEESENGEAIYALYRAGILTGNDAQGTFGPETSINRAAAAAILTRMADPGLRKNITL
ncbi:MAG: S-layer homology domain-containing protein [Oscillibacter sp.]|nr:S-layer homology domain-containing protein [Oscillibacter sp.]